MTRFSTQADADYVAYQNKQGDKLTITRMNHSTTSASVGTSAAGIAGTVAGAAVKAIVR